MRAFEVAGLAALGLTLAFGCLPDLELAPAGFGGSAGATSSGGGTGGSSTGGGAAGSGTGGSTSSSSGGGTGGGLGGTGGDGGAGGGAVDCGAQCVCDGEVCATLAVLHDPGDLAAVTRVETLTHRRDHGRG